MRLECEPVARPCPSPAELKSNRPRVGLLARGSQKVSPLARLQPSPASKAEWHLWSRCPHTVAGPRRLLTGFPVVPSRAPAAQALTEERSDVPGYTAVKEDVNVSEFTLSSAALSRDRQEKTEDSQPRSRRSVGHKRLPRGANDSPDFHSSSKYPCFPTLYAFVAPSSSDFPAPSWTCPQNK